MHVGLTVSLLLSTVLIAVIPAFGMLYVLHSFLPEDPHTLFSIFTYIIQTVSVWIVGFFTIFIYADLVFPIVMTLFGRILSHQSTKISTTETNQEKILQPQKELQNKKIE